MIVAVTWYSPPSVVFTSQRPGESEATTAQSCASTSLVMYSPFLYSQSMRAVRTSILAPGATLPSRSTPMTSIFIGVPFST